MSLFRIENASFNRGRENIFKELSFSLKNGEILAILGQNGVGKTTLIQCCIGLLRLNSGSIFLNEKPLNEVKNIFSKIAYIPQAKNLNISLKVLDMVLLGFNSFVKFKPSNEQKNQALELLKKLNLKHLSEKACDKLSGGELQMVIFARALVSEPELIILDEPESNLDFKNQHKVLQTLRELKVQNKGIIINTHYPQNALSLADKILILHKNKPHIFGDKKLINPTQLSSSFDTPREFFDFLAVM